MKKGVGNVTVGVFLVMLVGIFMFSFWQVGENSLVGNSALSSNAITGFSFHDKPPEKIPGLRIISSKQQIKRTKPDGNYYACLTKWCSDSDAKTLNEDGNPNIKGYMYGKNEKGNCIKVEDTCKDANKVLEFSCPEYQYAKTVSLQAKIDLLTKQIDELQTKVTQMENDIVALAKKIYEAKDVDQPTLNGWKLDYTILVEETEYAEAELENLKNQKKFLETKAGYEFIKVLPAKTIFCQYGCIEGACQPKPETPSCKDNKCNQNEDCAAGKSSVPDCGGVCPKCATCYDNKQNQGEVGIDCGGPCKACASCSDGKWNQNEDLIDCGGVCPLCPQDKVDQCSNKLKDNDETGIDCGGKICPACKEDVPNQYTPSCFNGIFDTNEEKTDCGGDCPPCKSIDPSCSDKKKNGYETGVDCGGFQCPACDVPGAGCKDTDESSETNDWSSGIPGTVTEKNNPTNYVDECIDNKNLKEFVCSNNKKKEQFYSCKDKCLSDPKGPDYCTEEIMCNDPDVNAGSYVVDYVFGEYEFKFERVIPSTVTVTSSGGKQIASSNDTCSGNTLIEKYCNGDTGKEIWEYDFDCTFEVMGEQPFDACSTCGGVGFCCKNKHECKESDGGKNIEQASATVIPPLCDCSGAENHVDICGISYCDAGFELFETTPVIDAYCNSEVKTALSLGAYGDVIREYYCEGLSIKSEMIACPEGEACIKGACKPYNTCVDTDAEKYPYTFGTIPGEATGIVLEEDKPPIPGTIKDKCLNNEVLLEAKCGGVKPSQTKYHKLKVTAEDSTDKTVYNTLAQPQYYAMYAEHICKVCKPQNGTWKCMGKCVESDKGAYCDITKPTYS